jgi:hypothetical protein
MNIKTERSEIIKKVDRITDESLLHAIRNLVDFGLSYQPAKDLELEASIDRALVQLEQGKGRATKAVMASVKRKYKS